MNYNKFKELEASEKEIYNGLLLIACFLWDDSDLETCWISTTNATILEGSLKLFGFNYEVISTNKLPLHLLQNSGEKRRIIKGNWILFSNVTITL